MIPFRKYKPKRRNITRKVKSHSEHKDDLKKDYKSRCGYCDDIDRWRKEWFEIDHFVPKKHLKTIKDTDYSNLVYSCRSCNNAKRDHWPTMNELIHHENNEGFIDPCDEEYGTQFRRNKSGEIFYQTSLGKWMYYKLKLHKPQHEIIWLIEEVDEVIEKCEELLKHIPNAEIQNRLLYLYRIYRKYTKQLGET